MNPKPNSPPNSPDAAGRPTCYGNLFPDFSRLSYNRNAEGHAFDVLVESCGVSVQRKTVTFKPDAWAPCVASPHFDECYRLSVAKLLLDLKLDRYT